MNILMGFSDNGAMISSSSDFRIRTPWAGINLYTPHRAHMMPLHRNFFQEIADRAEWADAFIFERNYYTPYLEFIQELRKRYPTKAFIATFDDGYAHATPDMNLYDFWIGRTYTGPDGRKARMPFDPVKQFFQAMGFFDAIFVPNHELVKDFTPYAPTYFVNSFLNTEPYTQARRVREEDGKIVIGIGAGASHFRSFTKSGVLEALQRILREYEHVEFWLRADPRIVKEARRLLDPRKLVWQAKGVMPEEWSQLLPNFDIGLAVLDPHGKFDARRSPIKIFEHMLARVPVIASASPTYADYTEYGLFCANQIEWHRAFKQVIDNYAAHREAYVQKAYDFACSIDIKHHVHREYIERIQTILDAKGHVYDREKAADPLPA